MSLIKVIVYKTSAGKIPYSDWEEDLDRKTQSIIQSRLARIRLGNFGDSKVLKDGAGMRELRIDYGPGYRIYFGLHGAKVVILLAGGDKSSQQRDIAKAKKLWIECQELL